MINKQKLKEIMQFIEKKDPSGNMISYLDIIENKRSMEDYEVENIIEGCMDEFTYEDLKLCGCGSPEKTWEVIRLVLIAQSQDEYENRINRFNNICNIDIENNNNYDGLIQFVLYVLDDHGFLEHGGCISSAWLTEKGGLFLDLLNMRNEIDDFKYR